MVNTAGILRIKALALQDLRQRFQLEVASLVLLRVLARGHEPATVRRIENLLYIAEYKRRQSPPGPRISAKSFGKDRRMPITNFFR